MMAGLPARKTSSLICGALNQIFLASRIANIPER
jgi:hypothetical protein